MAEEDTLITACRNCGSQLRDLVIDLGMQPLSNAYVRPQDDLAPETFFPLRVFRCLVCTLIQVPAFATRDDVFHAEYAYLSSYSSTWREHCEAYADEAAERLDLSSDDFIVEVASNDGYLLQRFQDRGCQVRGFEPTAAAARVAQSNGVPTDVAFFGKAAAETLLSEHSAPALVLANNVVAHVPDLDDFLAGFAVLANAGSVIAFEFPHVMRMIERNEFDTIYQEHYSYFSLRSFRDALSRRNLVVTDVEELDIHGGSLRVWCAAKGDASSRVDQVLRREEQSGLFEEATYQGFRERVASIREALLEFLFRARRDGKTVAGYGAAAKGNTLLNYCGVRSDLVSFVADLNPMKQGMLLPGSHIPIVDPERIFHEKPDYVLILPWNISDEIRRQLNSIESWDGRFVLAVPELSIR